MSPYVMFVFFYLSVRNYFLLIITFPVGKIVWVHSAQEMFTEWWDGEKQTANKGEKVTEAFKRDFRVTPGTNSLMSNCKKRL